MLSDVASLVVDFLSAEELKNLKLVEKQILSGPPGKYTGAKANNRVPGPGSLSEFFSFLKLRNPNLYRLQDSVANLREITHLHLVFEYPHVFDTSHQRLCLQQVCPLLKYLTLEGPQRFCNQVLGALDQHTLNITTKITVDPIMITKNSIGNASQYDHQHEFIIAH